MKNFFKNGAKILTSAQTNILSAATAMMAAVFVSRILGLVRNRLLAQFFSPDDLGLYFAAFRIPDFIFSILVMGALSTAFIPVITALVAKEKKEEIWKVSSTTLNIGLIIFFFFFFFIFIFSYPLSTLIAPGFTPDQISVVSNLTRIMLIGQLFFVISNFLTGILQSFKRFIIPAFAPVAYNLGIIIGILFFNSTLGIYAPAVGVVIGTFFHFIIQLPLAKNLGLSYKFKIDLKNLHVRKIGKLMIPRAISLGASQINYTIDNILASLISASAITVFNFALQLQQLPIGLFGATIAQAALPTLSESAAKEDKSQFQKTLISSFHQISYLVLPAAVILIVLRIPLVRLAFGTARFDWDSTLLTGMTLGILAFGLFAQSQIHLLIRGFFALSDTKTPLFVGLFAITTNIILSIALIIIYKFPIWGLAISSSIADVTNASILLYLLDRKIGGIAKRPLLVPFFKIISATFFMSIFLYFPMKILDVYILDTTRTINLLILTVTVTALASFFYYLLSKIIKIDQVKAFEQLVKKAFSLIKLLGHEPKIPIPPPPADQQQPGPTA